MPREYKVIKNRLLMIDKAIRTAMENGKKINTSNLSKLTGMNSRTILRDIEYMRDVMKVPIEYDASKKSFYYTQENYYLKAVPLTEGELFSIALFDQLLEQYRNTPLEEALKNIFTKIVQSLPDNVSVDTGFLNSQVSFISDKIRNIDLKVFQTIFSAMQKKRTITFEYRSLVGNEYKSRNADPYHAICHRGNWYLIAYCHERKIPRMFTFTRIRKAVLSKSSFSIPHDFDPNKYFDKEMGVWASYQTPKTIEIRFIKEAKVYATERIWHSSQTIKENKDGSITLKFTTTQIPEVFRWILGQGFNVKVLKPTELVKMVQAEISKMKTIYK